MLFQKFCTEQFMSCEQILEKENIVKKLLCIQVNWEKKILKHSTPFYQIQTVVKITILKNIWAWIVLEILISNTSI